MKRINFFLFTFGIKITGVHLYTFDKRFCDSDEVEAVLVAVCGVHMLIFQWVPNPHTVCAGQQSIARFKLGPGKDFLLHGSGSALKV